MNTVCVQQSKQQKHAPTQATKLTNPSSMKRKETKHGQIKDTSLNKSLTAKQEPSPERSAMVSHEGKQLFGSTYVWTNSQ